MSAASPKSMIIKQEWSETDLQFPISWLDSERAAEIWPNFTKLSWVVNKQKCTKIKQELFTQSQKKKDLNWVSNTI